MRYREFSDKLRKFIGGSLTKIDYQKFLFTSIIKSESADEKEQCTISSIEGRSTEVYKQAYYYGKGLEQLAQEVLSVLAKDRFEAMLKKSTTDIAKYVCDAFSSDILEINKDNYCKKLTDLFVDILAVEAGVRIAENPVYVGDIFNYERLGVQDWYITPQQYIELRARDRQFLEEILARVLPYKDSTIEFAGGNRVRLREYQEAFSGLQKISAECHELIFSQADPLNEELFSLVIMFINELTSFSKMIDDPNKIKNFPVFQNLGPEDEDTLLMYVEGYLKKECRILEDHYFSLIQLMQFIENDPTAIPIECFQTRKKRIIIQSKNSCT